MLFELHGTLESDSFKRVKLALPNVTRGGAIESSAERRSADGRPQFGNHSLNVKGALADPHTRVISAWHSARPCASVQAIHKHVVPPVLESLQTETQAQPVHSFGPHSHALVSTQAPCSQSLPQVRF